MNISSRKLQDHYNRKYASEKKISINSSPLNRLQMAAKYASQNTNGGGDILRSVRAREVLR